ncbi:HD domain-containing phosphohydrolase [Acholeplasma hippikon]|uniref:HD domain-containing phosphohydrolase n=1 Tax=Acholeplasma hippikon TaxID=264636 RepID=UPI0022B2955A|nr:HD domain-containing phosphohydrolase [Acholeplasma hippikon]
MVIGLASVLIMVQPFKFSEGLFIDTRTVLYVIVGHFFGLIPTIISSIIGITYRMIIGGEGVFLGVIAIIMNALVGLSWNTIRQKLKFRNIYLDYYLMGLLSQVLTMLLFASLPNATNIFGPILVAYIAAYPLVTLILSIIVVRQRDKRLMNEYINNQKTLLKKSIDSTETIEIFTVDKNYNYLTYNAFHLKQMRKYNSLEVGKNSNFIEAIKDPYIQEVMKDKINRTLLGFSSIKVLNMGDHYYEYTFTPLVDKNHVIGVTCFAKDVTEQKTYEQTIIQQSYQDALTGLSNRRHFMMKKDELQIYEKVTFVTCDVNGLKVINDAFGHAKGDLGLKMFADILKDIFDREGYIFRMGGDEFSIIVPSKDKVYVTKLMEEVNYRLEKRNNSMLRLSVSYGIATADKNTSIDVAIRQSEEQMYKQKLFETTSYRSKFIETILQSLYEKNPNVEIHSERVSVICVEIGKKLKMNSYELKLLKVISSLHDIGKIAIDEGILNKPGKLTDEEWIQIKRHPEIGYRIISSSPEYQEIAYDILCHHERYDGKGYPQGLSGENIPIRARIINLADSFDAMTSNRSYREPMSIDDAILEVKRCSGTQFDPRIVDVFLELIKEGFIETLKS